MKILLLVSAGSEKSLGEFYSGLHKEIGSVDLRRLNTDEQSKLKLYFSQNVDLARYDRIVFSLGFDELHPQLKFLQTLRQLVILDFESHHDFLGGTHKNKHAKFYKKIPWARVIVNSQTMANKLNDVGLDSVFVPKGFLSSHEVQRSPHPLRNNNKYPKRKKFLSLFSENFPELSVNEKFATGNACELLSLQGDTAMTLFEGLKVFIFPDIERGEYSVGVFKAMSGGHLVFAYNQGEVENQALGLQDMKNIVLFFCYEDFIEKIQTLVQQPDSAYLIAQAGKEIAEKNCQQYEIGVKTAKNIVQPVRNPEDFRLGLSFLGLKF